MKSPAARLPSAALSRPISAAARCRPSRRRSKVTLPPASIPIRWPAHESHSCIGVLRPSRRAPNQMLGGAPQDDVCFLMAFRNVVILRRLRSGRLEGRIAAIQYVRYERDAAALGAGPGQALSCEERGA